MDLIFTLIFPAVRICIWRIPFCNSLSSERHSLEWAI